MADAASIMLAAASGRDDGKFIRVMNELADHWATAENRPDEPLLRLGAEWIRLTLRQDALCEERENLLVGANAIYDESASWDLTDRFHAILDEMMAVPALTLEGQRVKALPILHWTAPEGETPNSMDDGRVAWSLACDILGSNPYALRAQSKEVERTA